MAVLTKPLPHIPSCLQRAERLRAGWKQSSPARKMHFPVGTRATRCGWVLWGLGSVPGVWCSTAGLGASPKSFSRCCLRPARPSSPFRQTQTQDRHAHTLSTRRERGAQTRGMSLCTNAPSALGPAAARAPHFLLHVVVELEFGLVGQLHGPVLQFPAGRGQALPFCPRHLPVSCPEQLR